MAKRKGKRPSLGERIDERVNEPPPEERCLVCGGPARRFGWETFPRISDFIGGRMTYEELERLVRQTFNDPASCFFAPKSFVSVCRDRAAALTILNRDRMVLR
jgi:hypothetical protein